MTFFVLPLALIAILAALALTLGIALVRAIRRALLLREAEFQVEPRVVRPGEGMRASARVTPRGRTAVETRAVLACTMFDFRPRALYTHAHALTPVHGKPEEQVAFVQMPAFALRSGTVGDELSSLFSEDAHRLLIAWSVEFEVHLAGRPTEVIARASIPVDVPEGRPLQANRAYMEQLVVETCRAMHSNLMVNWLVQLASADGTIDPRERELLHHVLRAASGVDDPVAADARIELEQKRRIDVDPVLLRKHVPPEALASFYRFLFAMAWRDGQMDGREHAFLTQALEKFGLDPATVKAVERDVLVGMAQRVD